MPKNSSAAVVQPLAKSIIVYGNSLILLRFSFSVLKAMFQRARKPEEEFIDFFCLGLIALE